MMVEDLEEIMDKNPPSKAAVASKSLHQKMRYFVEHYMDCKDLHRRTHTFGNTLLPMIFAKFSEFIKEDKAESAVADSTSVVPSVSGAGDGFVPPTPDPQAKEKGSASLEEGASKPELDKQKRAEKDRASLEKEQQHPFVQALNSAGGSSKSSKREKLKTRFRQTEKGR